MDDPELVSLTQITKALAGLSEEQMHNVLLYVNARYGGRLRAAPPGGGISSAPVSTDELDTEAYENMGDFFDATDPQTEADRVLVAAYWLQIIEETEDFAAINVNGHLKDLGHTVSNITRAFDSLINRSPRLARQIAKSGSAKQARKRYKVTREGIKRVKSMLAQPTGVDNDE